MHKISVPDSLLATHKMVSKNIRQTSALCNAWIGKIMVGIEKAAAGHTQCNAGTEVSLDSCEGSTINKFTLQLKFFLDNKKCQASTV